MALSLYNKYRPQTFGDVVGQNHVETTLANAVDKNTVSHAYLFCGPRGTGKTTTARILAMALLCECGASSHPCGTCSQCKAIADGIHPDVYELDAASRTGVDNVREEIIGRVNFAPTQGKHKIYIIDEVHMLSNQAFNALLKTLEEPPPHVVFVLCTTDVHKVPDTVQARCQRFDFKRIGAVEIVGRLQYISEHEGFDSDPAALELIAQRSQGGMRDAIRSLEQVAVFSGGKITYAAAEALLGMVDAEQLFVLCDILAAGDAAGCFGWVASYVQSGSDIAILVNDLAYHVRNLYAVLVARENDESLASALEVDAATLPRLREQAATFGSAERLGWILSVLGALSAELKSAANARLALEVALTRILHPESEQSIEALAARVALLEEQLAKAKAGETQGSSRQPTSLSPAPVDAPSVSHAIVSEVAPDPEPQPTPVASTNEVGANDDQSLHRQWNNVVDAIKKEKRGVAASLGGISPKLSSSGTKLALELPADAATSKQYLESEANKRLVLDTVAKIFGRPLEVAFVLASGETGGASSAAALEGSPRSGNQDSAQVQEPTPVSQNEDPSSEPNLSNRSEQNGDSSAEPSPPCHPERSEGSRSEPSKEELDSILSSSFNGAISFEEDH